VAVIPAVIGVQVYRRRKALANDTVAAASGPPVEEG
jgi:putative oxidoreductase